MNGNLLKYSKYGWPAVVMSLVMVIYLIIQMFLGFMGSHIDVNTEVMRENTRTNQSIIHSLDNLDETIEDFIRFNGNIRSSLGR